jgi:uncharacterized protein YegL
VSVEGALPGGRISSRPLHFVWLVDTSGSMGYEGKIQALNNAVREAIPPMRDAAAAQPQAQVLVRVISFSEGARWVLADPTPVEEFTWTDLAAGGTTDLGSALAMVADQLRVPPMSERALPPVLVLISDGQPTDDFGAGLDRLLAEPWGVRAVRVAIAIGRDADSRVLHRFINNPDVRPVMASNPEQLMRYIRWASTLITPVSRPPREGQGLPSIIAPDPVAAIGDITW